MEVGRLSVVATPIGNLADLSPRAEQALRDASVWFVEDTRVSGKLQAHLGVKRPMRVLNDHSGAPVLDRYAAELAEGAHAALLSDGGAPGISDPGALLVDRCHESGVPVEAVPGPSAVVTALMASGFFAQRFAFLGFLPRKPGPMRSELLPFADSPMTLVAFESPHRLEKLLDAAAAALGERRYAVCREMTKTFEQCWRARLPRIPTGDEVPRKGEMTIVFEGIRRRVGES
ncbi:MAG: 16S rRNA (cytidine(1402)-2'-O)-methyltransferase [Fimbriimonadaceae bacterium]|nr:16S rRNA (cytidine(1402)-2'-O)-methyltransferase [Fimbriimonadaceae bacterium]